jgi:recombination protein RecT
MENQTQVQTTNGEHKNVSPVVALIQSETIKTKFNEMLGKRSAGFIASLLSIVSQNDLLKKADPNSVYLAAMMAASLDLPINPNLGFAYIIPYNESYKDSNGDWQKKAVGQFQMGYKGYIQLAQRSGLYKTISAAPVYEGQLITQDPLKGFEFDWTKKLSDKVIGFAAYFSLMNGFEKTMFMTTEQLQKHGAQYSKTYNNSNSRWKVDFEAMASKTVLKLLISKYGPMTVEMQKAQLADQGVIHGIDDNDVVDVQYVDNQPEQITEGEVHSEFDRIHKLISEAKTPKALNGYRKAIAEFQGEESKALLQLFSDKEDELNPKKEEEAK